MCCTVDRGRQPAIAESGLFHRADRDGGTSVFQYYGAGCVGWHQVAAEFVMHRYAVLRNTVTIELHLDGCFFTGSVNPVGMVGYGDPQDVASLWIVSCEERCDAENR